MANGPGWMEARRYRDGFHTASEFLALGPWRRPTHKPPALTAMERLLRGAK